jgi:hypothetical protein
MQMAQRCENCPRADTFDGLPVDARQSGVIAEPSFLEDESSPAGFRRFAQHPENSDVGSEAEAAEHGMLGSPRPLPRPFVIINQMAKSVSSEKDDHWGTHLLESSPSWRP